MRTTFDAINKISRPRLLTVFERERVFQLLDEASRYPVIWVSSPAGAGKTTLVTSYLESRQQESIWYQVDPRDADPATFFYYMTMAAKRANPRKRNPLPLLTPEAMPDVEIFALRYFEALYKRLHPPMVIVIDNYQLIPTESILHGLIKSGLSILPEGVTAIVISREPPPTALSRMLINRNMLQIGWDQVRLTRTETAGIARLQAIESIPETTVNRLHAAAAGWAAGLILMLAQTDLEEIDWQWVRSSTSQEILDYFAKEVFENEPPETRAFLLRASFLPHMTIPMARTLSGHPRAGQILSELNRCNRFTELRLQKRRSYQFHPLFREFLLSRSRIELEDRERDELCRTAAALLQNEGDTEAAAKLLRDAEAWESLTELILTHAPLLIRQGRNMLLADWIHGLPDEIVQTSGWLLYWLGSCQASLVPNKSRGILEDAYRLFNDQQDMVGVVMSWCALELVYFLECADYSPLDGLIDDVFKWLPRVGGQLPPDLAAMLGFHIFSALNMRQPQHPQMENFAEQVDRLVDLVPDIGQRLLMGSRLAIYRCMQGELWKATRLVHILGPLARDESVAPFPKLGWLCAEATHAHSTGAFDECMRIVAESESITRKTGVLVAQGTLLSMAAFSSMRRGDYKKAEEYLNRMGQAILPERFFEYALHRIQTALCLALKGELGRAMQAARAALDLALKSGSPFVELMSRFAVGQLHTDRGEYRQAADELERAGRLGSALNSPLAEYTALLFNAQLQFELGNEEAGIRLLRKGLALGREKEYCIALWDRHDAIADLYVRALQVDIETGYVCEVIRRTNLIPKTPPVKVGNWPWPLKVYALGRFSIVKEKAPIRFSTKAQKKPLELIKVLIALGGRDVDKAHISDILWPNADGDKANRAFSTTLHRLRRLLGDDRTVGIQDGKINLNPSFCWVDCWALERLLSLAEEAADRHNPSGAADLTDRAVAIYRGAFLADNEQAPWAVSARERLRSRFLRTVNRVGSDLAASGQWEQAAGYYRHILDVDNLSEEAYRRLMLCLRQLGRRTEALSVYERCRKTLQVAFGLEPSPETRTILRSLLEKG